jgi:hypothetical protein
MRGRTWVWVLLIAALLVCSLVGCFLVLGGGKGGSATAYVYLDGECVRTIDLQDVDEPYSFVVDGPIGTNTVSVEPGRIRVSHADCPDQICVEQGWVSDQALPIVCLPNTLVIQVQVSGGEAEIDGVTR